MVTPISAAVEGAIDEAVVRRLLASAGGCIARAYLGNGRAGVLKNLCGYNNAARFASWIVFVDLDDDACAPPFRQRWLPEPAPFMCFPMAVRSVEAWLMGDREWIAKFLRVRPSLVPADPENLPNPKDALVNLARHSRLSRIRDDMVPRPASGRRVGPLYTTRLLRFIGDQGEDGWRPEVAAAASVDSLARCLRAVTLLVSRAADGARR